MIMVMFRATPDHDDDLELHLATERRRNPIGALGRAVTFPFRAVAGIVLGVVGLGVAVVKIVLLPFRLVLGLIKRIVGFAADIVFALWRIVMLLVGLVVGLFALVFAILNATIGNLIRLVLKVVFGTLKFVLKVVTLGRFGRTVAVGAAGAAISAHIDDD